MVRAMHSLRTPLIIVCVAATGALGCAGQGAVAPEPKGPASVKELSGHDLETIGDLAKSAGDTTRAEQYYALARDRGGEERRVTFKLISTCTSDGRYHFAKEHAAIYVRKHPADTAVRYLLGSLSLASGDTEQARMHLERVVEEAPTMANAHYTLASLLRADSKRAAKAEEHLRAYLQLAPDGEFAEQARFYLAGGDQ